MSIQRYYNRVGYVTLNEGNEKKDEFRGLNFKFSCEVTYPPGEGRTARASVGILGLSAETVSKWALFCNSTTPTEYARLMGSKFRSVSVYAGYEGSFDESPLFVLPVAGAWMTPPPEMWLNISAYNTTEFSRHYYTVTMNSGIHNPDRLFRFSVKEICQKVADTIGAKLRWEVYKSKEDTLKGLATVNWNGTATDLVKKLNEIKHIRAYIGMEPPDIMTPVLFVEYNLLDEDIYDARVERRINSLKYDHGPTISSQTGMIGLPKITFGDDRAGQVEVTTLLRRDIEPGDAFTVESEYLKFLKAPHNTFRANKVKYEGELRGNLWQTTITGIPSDAYAKSLAKNKTGAANG